MIKKYSDFIKESKILTEFTDDIPDHNEWRTTYDESLDRLNYMVSKFESDHNLNIKIYNNPYYNYNNPGKSYSYPSMNITLKEDFKNDVLESLYKNSNYDYNQLYYSGDPLFVIKVEYMGDDYYLINLSLGGAFKFLFNNYDGYDKTHLRVLTGNKFIKYKCDQESDVIDTLKDILDKLK